MSILFILTILCNVMHYAIFNICQSDKGKIMFYYSFNFLFIDMVDHFLFSAQMKQYAHLLVFTEAHSNLKMCPLFVHEVFVQLPVSGGELLKLFPGCRARVSYSLGSYPSLPAHLHSVSFLSHSLRAEESLGFRVWPSSLAAVHRLPSKSRSAFAFCFRNSCMLERTSSIGNIA